ncbi:MFS transporter [Oceanotoga sp. DSM 15011]|uniref:Na+/melibiose symporter-like transporter n=1 Tax=Oceanotoga teriensis TaxID=515440 RepID=A0AA45HJW9_9BACT|nr:MULTISPECIES: MFS transporter [Oceanotoga]PWJ96646.1 Na+/melibiose symporter-like transporter [Oceanotoga teriensis]UYP00183.1 MFS transporter [Oceanotoga sp. DSM 15011]
MTKLTSTMKYSIAEGSVYNSFFIATQGFIITSIALFFGSNPLEISLISSFPVIAQLFQIFTKKILKKFRSRKKSLMFFAFLSRTVFLILPVLIFLDFKNKYILVAVFSIFSFFGTFVGNIWTSSMRDIIKFEDRGKYFGFRNIFSSISGIVMLFVYSQLLNLKDTGKSMLFITLIMSFFSIFSVYLLYKHNIPESDIKALDVKLGKTFKDSQFKRFLKFIMVWTFAVEFTRPYFSYYEITILNVNYEFLGHMSMLTSILSIFLYMLYGNMIDEFGNKNILSLGMTISTISTLLFFLMRVYNYKSIILMDSIFSAFAWSAINLAILNLLLEIAKDPVENYVAAYSIASGFAAICASLAGGFLGNFLKGKVFYIFDESYYGIQLIFIIGFILRIYSILLLSNVKAFEKPLKYKGIVISNSISFRRRDVNLGIYTKILSIFKTNKEK